MFKHGKDVIMHKLNKKEQKERDSLIAEDYKLNKNLSALCQKFNLTYNSIRESLKRSNIEYIKRKDTKRIEDSIRLLVVKKI